MNKTALIFKRSITLLLVIVMCVSMFNFNFVTVSAANSVAVTGDDNNFDTDIQPSSQQDNDESQPESEVEESSETEPSTEASSQEESEQPSAPITVDDVTNLKAVCEAFKVKLTWNVSANATEYYVYRSDEKANGLMSDYSLLVNVTSSEFVDLTVEYAKKYSYKVVACNSSDENLVNSNGVIVNTITAPADVTQLVKTAKTQSSISLSWSKSNGATGYVVYRCYAKDNGNYTSYIKIADTKTTAITDSGLSQARKYKYKVVAYRTDNDNTAYSTGTEYAVTTKPKAITGLTVVSKSTSAIKISWKANSKATYYQIYRAVENSNGVLGTYTAYKTTTSTTFKDTKLTQGTRYGYKVSVVCTVNNSEIISTGVAVSQFTKPNAVTNLRVKKNTTTAVTIKWSANKNADKYLVYRSAEKTNGKMSSYTLCKTLPASTCYFKDTGLVSGRAYSYKVVVKVEKGSVYAQSTGVAVDTFTKPATPKSLKCSEKTDKRITLTWKGSEYVDKYVIYRGSKKVGTTTKTTFTDKKLKGSKTYKYTVKAIKNYNGKKYTSTASKIKVKTYKSIPDIAENLSGTWVSVSIEQQKMTMWINGKEYVSTPVVTGTAGPLSTTKGLHHVLNMSTNARLRGSYNGSSWDVVVNYWVCFTSDGQGLHDSTWRYNYGGEIYKTNGSHGCVNTPIDAMKKIYKKCYVGMPILVY